MKEDLGPIFLVLLVGQLVSLHSCSQRNVCSFHLREIKNGIDRERETLKFFENLHLGNIQEYQVSKYPIQNSFQL